jgi:hypothetical protein
MLREGKGETQMHSNCVGQSACGRHDCPCSAAADAPSLPPPRPAKPLTAATPQSLSAAHPMPGATARGMLATAPMRKQAIRDVAAVAVMRLRRTSSCCCLAV